MFGVFLVFFTYWGRIDEEPSFWSLGKSAKLWTVLLAPLEHGTTSPSTKEQEGAGQSWVCSKSPNNPGNRQVTANSLAERGADLGYSPTWLGGSWGGGALWQCSVQQALSCYGHKQSEMGARPAWHMSWVHPHLCKRVCKCFNTHKHHFFQLGQFTGQNKVHLKAGSRSLRKVCPWLCQTELCTGLHGVEQFKRLKTSSWNLSLAKFYPAITFNFPALIACILISTSVLGVWKAERNGNKHQTQKQPLSI